MAKFSAKLREKMLNAAFGEQSIAPMNTPLWFFGIALYDALCPLTGETPMVERWPDWASFFGQAAGQTVELKDIKLVMP